MSRRSLRAVCRRLETRSLWRGVQSCGDAADIVAISEAFGVAQRNVASRHRAHVDIASLVRVAQIWVHQNVQLGPEGQDEVGPISENYRLRWHQRALSQRVAGQ